MFSSALMAAGVLVSVSVIKFITGELLESEEKKYKELKERLSDSDARMQQARESFPESKQWEIYKEVIYKKNEYLNSVLDERIKDVNDLRNQINDSICNVNEVIHSKSASTPLRKTTLENLLNQLYEAKERAFGYSQYLIKYREYLRYSYSNDYDPECFEIKIPDQYPYIGKVLDLQTSSLQKQKDIELTIIHGIKIKYRLNENEDIYQYKKYDKLPFMVETYNKYERTYIVSLDKGVFFRDALQDTRIGVRAVVSELKDSGVILTYGNNLKLYMKNENLLKPYRKPPIRSNMTVYPIYWTYGLKDGKNDKCPVRVSERSTDATSSLRFEKFPLLIRESDFYMFYEYLQKNNLLSAQEEISIGPFDENCIELKEGTKLKIQIGDLCIILCSVVEYFLPKTNNTLFFCFEKFLSLDYNFKPDDIFIRLDVEYTPVLAQMIGQQKH